MIYEIIGVNKKGKDCLVYICNSDKEYADKILDRILNNPTKDDLINTEDLIDLKVIEDVDSWLCK